MEILEFGNQEKDILMLIHGFETPWQVWEEYIAHFRNRYHIIVPVLPGHNPKQKEAFLSIEQCAAEVEALCESRLGNHVHALYVMSMGGIIAAQLWQNQKMQIDTLIMESSPLTATPRFISGILAKMYLMMTHKTQKRDAGIIRKATGSIIPENKLDKFLEMMDGITDSDIIHCVHSTGSYQLPEDIRMPDTGMFYFHGTGFSEILAKKTARFLRKYYPQGHNIIFQGKAHCEDSILNPMIMIAELEKIL